MTNEESTLFMQIYCWYLIGQNQFCLQTSTDAKLAIGFIIIQVYRDWCRVHLYSYIAVPSKVYAMYAL